MNTRRARRATNRDFLRIVISLIRNRLRNDEELSVKTIARDLGYTRQHVSARFRRVTGRALGQFLRNKRLQKAARLLKSGEETRVEDLARRCGFQSANHFRQQFHRRYGMSPRQFRSHSPGRSKPDRTAPEEGK